jgi:hypothetical protein
MITFKHYLTEAVRAGDFAKTSMLIKQYLQKKIGKVYFFPTPEVFNPSGAKKGVGIKFFVLGNKAIRFNWERTVSSSLGLKSIDYWDGTQANDRNGVGHPSSHISFGKEESLVKVLPFVVDFLQGKVDKKSTGYIAEEFEMLDEAYTKEQISKTIKNSIDGFRMGTSVRDQYSMDKKYGPKLKQVIDTLRSMYPSAFIKQGAKIIVDKTKAAEFNHDKVLAAVFGSEGIEYTVSAGSPEKYEVKGAEDQDIDRMNYEEQLQSLQTGMKLLMSNATNAMFVGGRGGTGKTQTVEDMLHQAGKSDGSGYFKITGSATPTGIYRILYTHRRDIVLFDDSDSALNDQEGRNLFKAAADTKKVRKISWMKGGKNFVDPDNYDEDSDDDTLPRSFEFVGKIIFISNLPLNKLDPDGALQTRGYVLNVDPTNEEIYDFMYKIATKIPLDVDYELNQQQREEVIDVLKSRRIPEKKANLRSLVRALNTRAGIELQGGSKDEWTKFVKLYA